MDFHSQSFLLLFGFLLVFIQAQKVDAIRTSHRRQSTISRRKQCGNQTNDENHGNSHRKMSQRQSREKVVAHYIIDLTINTFESENAIAINGAILQSKKIKQSTQNQERQIHKKQ